MTENKWTRLTKERFENYFAGRRKATILRQYEIQYLVVPEEEWKTLTHFDDRMRHNIERPEPKLVYRYRLIDHFEAAFSEAVRTHPNVAKNKGIFALGYNYGKELK